MSQIAVFFGKTLGLSSSGFDLGIDAATAHLAVTGDLSTSIALSLLTDKRSAEGLVPAGVDRRGWWGDTYAEPGDGFGSWLWCLEGRPKNQETLDLADSFVRDALRWLIEDGIADRLEIEKQFAAPGLRVRVGIVHGTAIRWTEWWARTL